VVVKVFWDVKSVMVQMVECGMRIKNVERLPQNQSAIRNSKSAIRNGLDFTR
jgi:hypothetical protein